MYGTRKLKLPTPRDKTEQKLMLMEYRKEDSRKSHKTKYHEQKPHTIQETEYNTHSLEWNRLPQKRNHPTIIKLHTSHHQCNSNQPLARHQQTHLIKEIIFSLNLTYRAKHP